MRISDWSSDVCSSDLHLIGVTRTMLAIASVALYFATAAMLFAKTWRSPRVDYWVLNLTHGLMLIAGAHDLLVFIGISRDNVYYSSIVSQVLIVCMAVVMARKFVSAMRRDSVEGRVGKGGVCTCRARCLACQ